MVCCESTSHKNTIYMLFIIRLLGRILPARTCMAGPVHSAIGNEKKKNIKEDKYRMVIAAAYRKY